ncbi:sensor histidine kinase [Plantactinospora sp. S1510]|uniref:histidine kinase n=1 Tax=Plantactinospora alkalitolerans TaxID=2789879 RepID=A0ABS0HA73_9ACTN|nr:histidine kinase [Plantactinospora alkalitolerans]MBF9135379.1 sensor histidine kinase [Plantactinospora alkalitolerans]
MEQPTPRFLIARHIGFSELVVLDCLIAAGYIALALLLRHATTGDARLTGTAADVLVVATGLPVAIRRLWPVPVLGVVVAVSVVALVSGVVTDPFVAPALALYPVALARPGQRWIPAAAAGALGISAALATAPTVAYASWWLAGPGLILVGWALIAAAWTLGSATRQRRVYAAREAARMAEQAVTSERLRIARELHDVVAHSIGVIAVKAAVTNHLLSDPSDEVREALQLIEESSRSALTEMRHMLGVLRSDSGSGPGEEPAGPMLAPAPGPAGLSALVERCAAAGVTVQLHAEGVNRLPQALGLTIYRIVQEALTNAVKHAAPTRCDVMIRVDERRITIGIVDEGPPEPTRAPPTVPGHGLIGMRERCAIYDGILTAGPRPGGGYQVQATIPWEATHTDGVRR